MQPKEISQNKIEREQLEWLKLNPPSIALKFPDGEPLPNKKRTLQKTNRKKSKILSYMDSETDEEIDLHGLSIDQGIAAVEDILQTASDFGLKSVRIIHGIGPAGTNSMRTAVRKHLKTKCGKWVESTKIEGHNDGAIIVNIKRQKKRAHPKMSS
jgi:DNA-nicking Smr family endonuclease